MINKDTIENIHKSIYQFNETDSIALFFNSYSKKFKHQSIVISSGFKEDNHFILDLSKT